MKKLLYIIVLLAGIANGQKQERLFPGLDPMAPKGIRQESNSPTVPRRISYQGLLTKANGRAVQDGSYQVTFRFYKQIEDGTAFWEENQQVNIDDGIITTILGKENPIYSIPGEAYLEIEIDGITMSPRQELTSVFYSVVSDTAKYAQTANYTDLDSLPDLSIYANIDTLTSYPLISNLDSVAFTGDYNDLENLPDLSNLALDTLTSYTLISSLDSVAFTGDYNDLENLPDLSNLALDTLANYTLTADLAAIYATIDTLIYFQPRDSDLTAIAGLWRPNNSNKIIISSDSSWVSLGEDTARSALGLAIGSDIQAYDEDLDDLADGELSASSVEDGQYFINSAGVNGQVWTSDQDGRGAWAFPLIGETDVVGINAGTGLLGGGDSGLVFISVDVGTDSGQIVQLDNLGKLPAVDGSALFNVTAGTVAADDINHGDAAVTLSTSTGAINITPASGSAVVLDGTVNVDAGVVTGATSVTSESFTATTGIDVSGSGGITLENDETITNSTDGTVLVTSPTTSLSGDLTVTGNDIVFGNGETITNAANDTLTIGVAGASQVSVTDGTITPAAD
ncbi:MAG: hypothetical protein QF622_09065, partial [Candidatus Marinimicrobia bacterium]|nr:hypothetical protein [Candidatus Neomarinimicrobiota bacterium]